MSFDDVTVQYYKPRTNIPNLQLVSKGAPAEDLPKISAYAKFVGPDILALWDPVN